MRPAARLLACIFILWCNGTQAQVVAVGTANFQTKLYSSYGKDPYYTDANDIKAEITNGNKLYCYGVVDTVINRVKYTWAAVVYHNQDGYVPIGHIAFDGVNRVVVDVLPKSSNLRYMYAAYEAAKAGIVADSLQAITRKQEAIKAAKEAEESRINDSVSKVRMAQRIAKQGFGILSKEFGADDYSVDFNVSVANYAGKTIKYIWFTLAFYNPVDDLIGTKTVQGVGPIRNADMSSYEFENVLFTRVFGYGSLSKVRIQYMDGTEKNFTATQLRDLTFYSF